MAYFIYHTKVNAIHQGKRGLLSIRLIYTCCVSAEMGHAMYQDARYMLPSFRLKGRGTGQFKMDMLSVRLKEHVIYLVKMHMLSISLKEACYISG